MAIPPEIVYEKKGKIAYIRIDRPEKMNSCTPPMFAGIEEAFDDFNKDPDLWVAIFTGTGERAFCAGADLGSTIPEATAAARTQLTQFDEHRFFDRIFKPIIGAVNGFCIAGGLEMLQGVDIRIASENATFGLGEVRWAIVPGGGSHTRLPRQIPWAIAMEILLTGRTITAAQALDWGLVNRVVPLAELMPTAERFAEIILENGPIAVRTAKEIAVRVRNMAWGDAFGVESLLSARVMTTEDAIEGPKSFMEKRKAVYKGR